LSQNNIYPKNCGYGCNTRIYWNTSVSEYWEVLAQKKYLQRADDFLSLSKREQEERRQKLEDRLMEKRKKSMKQEKTWDGKPYYFDVDFTGVNLLDSLSSEKEEEKGDKKK